MLFRSYSPVVYQRTYVIRDSIYEEDYANIDTSGMQLTIRIKQTDAAMHKSLWADGEVNALLLNKFSQKSH